MDKEWWDGLTQSRMRIARDTSVDDRHSLTIDLYFGIILMHLHYKVPLPFNKDDVD